MKKKNARYIGPVATLAFAALLLIAAVVDGVSEMNYRRSLERAEAVVLKPTECGSAYGSKSQRAGIVYGFTAADGQKYTAIACGMAYEAGTVLPVDYPPDDPKRSRLAMKSQNDFMFFLWGGIFALVFGLWWFNKSRAVAEAGTTLLKTGKIADALVTIVMRYQGQIVYEFKDDRGKTYQGHMHELFFLEKDNKFRKGTRIDVRYDPKNPSINRWFPGEDQRVVYPEGEGE